MGVDGVVKCGFIYVDVFCVEMLKKCGLDYCVFVMVCVIVEREW